MRFKGQIWIERNLFLVASFFFWWLLEKFRNLSRDDDDDIINNKQKFCNIREDFTSLFSLSLSLLII